MYLAKNSYRFLIGLSFHLPGRTYDPQIFLRSSDLAPPELGAPFSCALIFELVGPA